MRKRILVILSLLCCLAVRAQPALIANDGLNVLYRNFDNKITLSKNGYDCNELKLIVREQFSKDTIQVSGNGCHYIIRTNGYGFIPIIVKAQRQSDTLAAYDTLRFSLVTLRSPTLTVGGKLTGGWVRGDVLRASTGLVAVRNIDMELRTEVVSFEFHYRTKRHKKDQDLRSTGPLFSQEILTAFSNMEEGDTVIFSHVNVRYAKMLTEDLGEMTFIIQGNKNGKEVAQRLRERDTYNRIRDAMKDTTGRESGSIPTASFGDKRIIGRWNIEHMYTDMAICGIPTNYCGHLAICDDTKAIRFSRNEFFTNDDPSTRKHYKLISQPVKANILILSTDTFYIAPLNKNMLMLVWFNGDEESSLYYQKLTFVLYRERKLRGIKPPSSPD